MLRSIVAGRIIKFNSLNLLNRSALLGTGNGEVFQTAVTEERSSAALPLPRIILTLTTLPPGASLINNVVVRFLSKVGGAQLWLMVAIINDL